MPTDPDYGPRGYLPERAAKRARKIVLREQMGLQWPIAAVVAAILVLLAGAVFLATGTGPPEAPFSPVATIDEVDPRGAEVLAAGVPASEGLPAPAADIAVVRAGGGVRVFAVPDAEVVWCAASGRLEHGDGSVWNPNGRLVGGGAGAGSLEQVAAQVYDGVLYVDVTARAPAAPPALAGEAPECAG
jgi:hypothetical protein